MKIIIAGGRNFNNYALLCESMSCIKAPISEIVCGCASGADKLGEKWAIEHNIPIKYFPADWDTYGRSAGPIRNKQMAEYGDILIAFWDGTSKGTKNMINTMEKLGKYCFITRY